MGTRQTAAFTGYHIGNIEARTGATTQRQRIATVGRATGADHIASKGISRFQFQRIAAARKLYGICTAGTIDGSGIDNRAVASGNDAVAAGAVGTGAFGGVGALPADATGTAGDRAVIRDGKSITIYTGTTTAAAAAAAAGASGGVGVAADATGTAGDRHSARHNVVLACSRRNTWSAARTAAAAVAVAAAVAAGAAGAIAPATGFAGTACAAVYARTAAPGVGVVSTNTYTACARAG